MIGSINMFNFLLKKFIKRSTRKLTIKQENASGLMDVLEHSTKHQTVVGYSLTFLVLIVGVFCSSMVEISGAVVSQGDLRTLTQKKPIANFKGGVVSSILIRNGQTVSADQLLMTLDDTSIKSEIEIIEFELDALLPKMRRLKAESHQLDTLTVDEVLEARLANRPFANKSFTEEKALFIARRTLLSQEHQRFDEKVKIIENQVTGLLHQIKSIDKQIVSVTKELSDLRSLFEKGLTQRTHISKFEREVAAYEGKKGELNSQLASLEREIVETNIQKLQKSISFSESALLELNELQALELSLMQKKAAFYNELAQTQIRAPEDGIIVDLAVKVQGNSISPSEVIMYIVPSNDPLILETHIPPHQRDKIYPGQTAQVVFSSLDLNKLPQVFGEVTRISATSKTNERNGSNFFEVEIQLSEQTIDQIERNLGIRLTAGMPAEAYLQTQQRSILDYLLEPIHKSMRKTFREP